MPGLESFTRVPTWPHYLNYFIWTTLNTALWREHFSAYLDLSTSSWCFHVAEKDFCLYVIFYVAMLMNCCRFGIWHWALIITLLLGLIGYVPAFASVYSVASSRKLDTALDSSLHFLACNDPHRERGHFCHLPCLSYVISLCWNLLTFRWSPLFLGPIMIYLPLQPHCSHSPPSVLTSRPSRLLSVFQTCHSVSCFQIFNGIIPFA